MVEYTEAQKRARKAQATKRRNLALSESSAKRLARAQAELRAYKKLIADGWRPSS